MHFTTPKKDKEAQSQRWMHATTVEVLEVLISHNHAQPVYTHVTCKTEKNAHSMLRLMGVGKTIHKTVKSKL